MTSQDTHGSFYSERSLRHSNKPKLFSRSYKMRRVTSSRDFKVTMAKNLEMPIFVTHHSSTKWSSRKEELSYSRNCLINDALQKSSQLFWGEAVNNACHIINRVYLRPRTNKTPYDCWKWKKPTTKYFHVFGSKFYILRDRRIWVSLTIRVMKGYSMSSKVSVTFFDEVMKDIL
jgi:hypothetical protein